MRKALTCSAVAFSMILGWISLGPCGELDDILQEHMKALGGRENLLKVKAVYSEATVKVGGLEGKLKLWWSLPNRVRQEIDFSIFAQLVVGDGENFWMKDQNGKVRELVGYEREKLEQELFFEALAYLFPERGKGKKRLVGEGQTGEGKCFVVEVTPEGGEPRKLFIGASSYLIRKYREPADEETVTVFLADYHPVDGIMTPFSQHQTTGKPQYDTYVEYENILLNPSLSDTLFVRPRQKERDFAFTTPVGFTKIPFNLISNHIYMEVRVNDSAPLSFILDTGAGANCLDLSRAQKLALPSVGRVEAKGVGGSADAWFLKVDSIMIGDVTLLDQNLASILLSPLGRFDGTSIDGILGYDFFGRFPVEIDYADETLTVWDPDSFTYSGWGEKLDVLLEGNTPQVVGILDGEQEVNFRIDTGSRNSLDLHAPFVREHNLLEKYPDHLDVPAGFGVGGVASGVVGRIKSLQIGSFVIPSPVTGFSTAEEGAFATTKSAGNIGGGVLNRFKVIFDYAHSQMILEKNESFDLPDRYNTSGLVLIEEDGEIKAYAVIPDSPADGAGIRQGDKITRINNSPAGDYSLEQIRDILNQEEGRGVDLEIERDGKVTNLRLMLKELI